MQSPERSPIDTTPDLDWTAFRYVVGELSADETCRFEEQLAVDQFAREAVAGAVRLASAVAQGFPEGQVAPVDCVGGHQGVGRYQVGARHQGGGRRSSARWTNANWIRVGWVVGPIAAAVAFFFLVRDVQHVPQDELTSTGRIQNLATAWVASQSAEADSNVESSIPDAMTPATAVPEAETDMSTVPDWLLAAVSEKAMAEQVVSEQADAPKPAPERTIEN